MTPAELVDEVLPRLAAEWRKDADQFEDESMYGKALKSCAEDIERLLRAAKAVAS